MGVWTLNTSTALVVLSALLTGLFIRGGGGRSSRYRFGALLVVLASTVPYFMALAEGKSKQRLDLVRTVLKLAPMASIAQLCVRTGRDEAGASTSYAGLIAIGLGFSSCGDVALELNNDNPDGVLFLAGLGFFFVAHLLYIGAFMSQGYAAPFASPVLAALFYALAFTFFLVLRGDFVAWPADARLGMPGPLAAPVLAYATVIATMVWRAFSRLYAAPPPGASAALGAIGSLRWAALGALIFMVSDMCLGFAKFHTDFARAKYVVMVTYYAGQLAIAWSVHGSAHANLVPKSKQSKAKAKAS